MEKKKIWITLLIIIIIWIFSYLYINKNIFSHSEKEVIKYIKNNNYNEKKLYNMLKRCVKDWRLTSEHPWKCNYDIIWLHLLYNEKLNDKLYNKLKKYWFKISNDFLFRNLDSNISMDYIGKIENDQNYVNKINNFLYKNWLNPYIFVDKEKNCYISWMHEIYIHNKNIKKLNELIEKGFLNINIKSCFVWETILQRSINADFEIFKFLVDKWISLDAKDNKWRTILDNLIEVKEIYLDKNSKEYKDIIKKLNFIKKVKILKK